MSDKLIYNGKPPCCDSCGQEMRLDKVVRSGTKQASGKTRSYRIRRFTCDVVLPTYKL